VEEFKARRVILQRIADDLYRATIAIGATSPERGAGRGPAAGVHAARRVRRARAPASRRTHDLPFCTCLETSPPGDRQIGAAARPQQCFPSGV